MQALKLNKIIIYNKLDIFNWAQKPSLSVLTDSCYEKELNKFALYFFCSSLSPVDAMDILKQTRKKEKTKITSMYPRDFKRLFETIECSKGYTCKWLYDDFMEDIVIQGTGLPRQQLAPFILCGNYDTNEKERSLKSSHPSNKR